LPVDVPATVIGLLAALPVLVTPPLVEVHVAKLVVIGDPWADPRVNETLMGPVVVVVKPDAALMAVGAAGAEGFGSVSVRKAWSSVAAVLLLDTRI
jgi:hypothetical protein